MTTPAQESIKWYLQVKYVNNIVTTVRIKDKVLDLKLDKKIEGKMKIINPVNTCSRLKFSSIT